MSNSNEKMGCFSWLFLLVLAGAGAVGGYNWLDSMGRVSHTEETMLTFEGNWLDGESRECFSPVVTPANWAASAKKEVGSAMAWVRCESEPGSPAGGKEHRMEVTFFGRKLQPEYEGVAWRCKRTSALLEGERFTCYELGGVAPAAR